MRPIHNLRQKNLRRLIDSNFNGVVNQFATHVGMEHSSVWRLLTESSSVNRRNIGEKLARRIESSCELPNGWLDDDHDAPQVECLLTHRIKRLSADDRGKLMWVVKVLEESS